MSTTSPTAAGRPEPSPAPSAELIDAINQVFALFRANYHNQYYSAFGNDQGSVAITKKLWLQTLQNFSPALICQAAERIIAESEYLPTLHKMLEACRRAGLPDNLPSALLAYREACNAASPKAAQRWSHPAVYLAGRDCGWHRLANFAERQVLPEYSAIYQRYAERVAAGEQLAIEPPAALEEIPHRPASAATADHAMAQLKALFDLPSDTP
ncbi:hypothetical protein E3W66_06155 [Gammaproteobacteria bacterium LSUCC0057]|uniref:Replicative helicase inhibitor G39P N-terminal domain-containing protein n=1 Tax=Gammaproteobacteria bacterium LSUCC0057 TaxID=2559237 RepID=A0A4Y8UJF8_9GAMM|nr:hypothetical protein E3W66_06155 [Gammaproteobacteria bacterium LSUCC0057]